MRIGFVRDAARRVAVAVAIVTLAACAARPARAVVLDDENRLTITLKDRTAVTLLGVASGSPGVKTTEYYYLPANLHLATRPDSTPEFLFIKFTTEKKVDAGGLNGGLVHFLMEWGLTPAQEEDLRARLKSVNDKAVVLGAVPMETQGETGSFQIISGTLTDSKMAGTLAMSGSCPLVPGGRAAAAGRLTAEGAQLLATSLEKSRSISDVSIGLNFSYTVLAPAVRATMTVDWSKLEKQGETLSSDYTRTRTGTKCGFWSCSGIYAYSYEEAKDQFSFLEEKQVVQVHIEETVADERAAKVREAFLQLFLSAMAEPAPPPPPASDEAKATSHEAKQGSAYKFRQTSLKTAMQQKSRTFRLTAAVALRKPHTLVGNLGEWYDGVRDNPKCVSAVNLNDPFFQHRDIHFILDLDAKAMFEQEANYVTVNVRKKRSAGNAFEDRVTIDEKYVKEKGIDATVTYARGEDSNPDAYEYQTQWSFRGGRVWPPTPAWEKGSWEGVTLAAPIAPRTIEVEGDLEAMKARGITRVTVQIHYPKLGAELEENISVSPARNEPLVSKKLFMDRDARGYVYRLILDHKTEGKLALPWSAKAGDDYIYAVIPEGVLERPEMKEMAKSAAMQVATSAKDKVLARFDELIGGITK
ncbi:MAG: hypothetical protein HOP12_07045 [Candidatus Eisenbacteria bacterium]|uniref:Uncharacterized protein n=1 Tax=Eiseniibacteriota bacterium TaxID=2212470 RepID=A0A849SR82_UNCEI|nr:hypothetical protein [Candidatus Eisenbacteria bacterium]